MIISALFFILIILWVAWLLFSSNENGLFPSVPQIKYCLVHLGLSANTWAKCAIGGIFLLPFPTYFLLDKGEYLYAFLDVLASYFVLWLIANAEAATENYHRSVSFPDFTVGFHSRTSQDDLLEKRFDEERKAAALRRHKAMKTTPSLILKLYTVALCYCLVLYIW